MKRGVQYVSTHKLCGVLGGSYSWDMRRETVKGVLNGKEFTIRSGNSFYTVGKDVYQSIYRPYIEKGELFFPSEEMVILLSRCGYKATWNEKEKRISVDDVDKKAVVTTVQKSVEEKNKADSQKVSNKSSKNHDKNSSSKDIQKTNTSTKSSIPVAKQDKTNNDKKSLSKKNPPVKTKNREKESTFTTVVIDPGHGGKDPGAIGSRGLYEKDVTLSISLALKKELEKRSNLKVYLTRSTDVFIPLRKRTEFANKKKANLFISIHANSIGGSKKRKNRVKGYKVYFLSNAKNEEDKLAAMIENQVIEMESDGGASKYQNVLQEVLGGMANSQHLKDSQDFSIMLNKEFSHTLKRVKAYSKGVGQANFWVLNGAYMPAVLVETSFISNPKEEKLLRSKAFKSRVAKAITSAILRFKKSYEESYE